MKLVALEKVCLKEINKNINFNLCFYLILDLSFPYILKMYVKRHSLTNYGGNTWAYLTGFEQVVTDGTATYYAIDWGSSHIVKFNDYWEYQNYQNLSFPQPFTTKFVNGYFYFSSNDYFYKTNSNFSLINSYEKKGAGYRQFIFDSNSSKFYVAAYSLNRIDIFDASCSFLQSIQLGFGPFGLAYVNGLLYTGHEDSNKQISVIKNGKIIRDFNVSQCNSSLISGITMDSFGYMAISCSDSKLITVYDLNGNYMNTKISTSLTPYITSIDSNGRYVIMTMYSLDIYY